MADFARKNEAAKVSITLDVLQIMLGMLGYFLWVIIE